MRVTKCNIIYYKYLSLALSLALRWGRDVGVESGGDLWVVRVIKYNVIYKKCLSLALVLVLSLTLHYEPPGETFTT